MATQLPEDFDPESQDGNSWDLLPNEEYVAQIVEAAVLQPKTGDGYYIALTWKISEGPYEGRQVWQRITFVHSSEQAQTIGRKALKDLCSALEISEHINDVEVFLFKTAKIKVGVEKDKNGQFDDKNVVKRILPLDEPPATAPASSKPAPKSSPGSGSGGATPAAKPKPAAAKPGGSAPWHQG